MRDVGAGAEKMRVFSVVVVLGLGGGLTAFLFHDQEAVAVIVQGPVQASVADALAFEAIVRIPEGQRLPVAGATVVIEDVTRGAPVILDEATCWDACIEVRHNAQQEPVVASIRLVDASTQPSTGELEIRSEGYGASSTTGYGAEVEPQRSRSARDLVDANGVAGSGLGYAGSAQLRFAFDIPAGALEAGTYQLTFLVQTGSREMGSVSSPRAPLILT